MEQEPRVIVEAIEEGKIVRVSEEYAKREGLIVLKKIEERPAGMTPSYYGGPPKKEPIRPLKDQIGRRLDWREKQVVSELLENFNWIIRNERRKRGLTRRQFARIITESEENVKLIEAGYVPAKDFILINKIQKAFGVNLRKDGKNFETPIGDVKKDVPSPQRLKEDGIEIIDVDD